MAFFHSLYIVTSNPIQRLEDIHFSSLEVA